MQALTAESITPAICKATESWLLSKVLAECRRERVDKIIGPMLLPGGDFCGLFKNSRTGDGITTEKDMYLDDDSNDTQLSRSYYSQRDTLLREAGFNIKTPDVGECPALIAEHLHIKAEWLLVDAWSEILPGITHNKLLCAGLDTLKKFVDLAISLVVSLPDFEPPALPQPGGGVQP